MPNETPNKLPAKNVYEGGEGWEDYKKYLSAKKVYDQYSNEANRLESSGGYTPAGEFSASEFASHLPSTGFALPEGASGFKRYKANTAGENTIPQNIDYYSDSKSGYTYVPTYNAPENNYNVVDSPEVIKQRANQAKWDAYRKSYSGDVTTYFSEQQDDGTWAKTGKETKPWKASYGAAPTDGTFNAYGEEAPANFKYPSAFKYVASKKAGGLLSPPKFVRKGLLNL